MLPATLPNTVLLLFCNLCLPANLMFPHLDRTPKDAPTSIPTSVFQPLCNYAHIYFLPLYTHTSSIIGPTWCILVNEVNGQP